MDNFDYAAPTSLEEAVGLLLETAGLFEDEEAEKVLREGEAKEAHSRSFGLARAPEVLEIVDLCGRLPLAVAIAAGVVGNYGTVDREVEIGRAHV